MNTFFDGIYGQDKVKESLFQICLSGKIPHAFIFSGPDGCGKYITAIRFSQLLNATTIDAQFTTDNLISHRISLLQEPYIKYVIPLPRGKNETGDSASLEKIDKDTLEIIKSEIDNKIANPYYRIQIDKANNIKINSIREIKKFVSLNYEDIKYRIIIISDAQLMNDEAQNALLKSLEEPPEGVVFILTTNNINALLPTILSRCRLINFDYLSVEDTAQILINYFKIDNKAAFSVAPFANGSLYSALDYINSDFNLLLNKTINILRYSLALKFHSAYNEISAFLTDNSGKTIILLLKMIIFWFADVIKNKVEHKQYFFVDQQGTLEKFNQRFSNADVLKTITNFEKMIFGVENNANLNIVILNIIFEIASLRFGNN